MFLKKGALFVADVHYHPKLREEFVSFLERLEAPQLFLMGDIFDLLVGGVEATIRQNAPLIQALNQWCTDKECYYLEGNHDFLLSGIFPNIRVVDRFAQPLLVHAGSKRVALAHGDIHIDGLYRRYIEALQSPKLIAFLNFLNRYVPISRKIQHYNASKDLCRVIEDFQSIAQKRVEYYDADIVIEGHYHQRCRCSFGQKEYINLPAFACTQEVLVWDGEFSFARM